MKIKARFEKKIFGNCIIYKILYLEYIKISQNSVIKKTNNPKNTDKIF